MYTMVDENSTFFFILATIGVTYFLIERKRFLTWFKCKTSAVTKLYKCRSTTQKPKRLSLTFTSWDYRGEGNEYLAISLPEIRQILRLRKFSDSAELNSYINCSPVPNYLLRNIFSEAEARKFEKLSLEYYKVVAFLIGDCYVQPAEDVLLVKKEIDLINKAIFPLRPEHRKTKRVRFACGSLLTDYAYLPQDWDKIIYDGSTFAVELKPKQGWIASSERLYNLCTYCLNQYIKLENGDISSFSEFCPMDLYSGDKLRMKHALKCLLKTPQNNLKIFQNGQLIYGEGIKCEIFNVMSSMFGETNNISIVNVQDEFYEVMVQALLRKLQTSTVSDCFNLEHKCPDFIKNEFVNIAKQNTNKMCNFNREILAEGCVLDRILNLQALDIWGAETIARLWESPPYVINNYSHIESVNKRAGYTTNAVVCAKCLFDDNFSMYPTNDEPFSYLELITQQYLMSAVAKDCSLMITFKNIKNMANIQIPKQNIIITKAGMYVFKIGVFDLYPKPLSCLFKHVQKAHKFANIYGKLIIENGTN